MSKESKAELAAAAKGPKQRVIKKGLFAKERQFCVQVENWKRES